MMVNIWVLWGSLGKLSIWYPKPLTLNLNNVSNHGLAYTHHTTRANDDPKGAAKLTGIEAKMRLGLKVFLASGGIPDIY